MSKSIENKIKDITEFNEILKDVKDNETVLEMKQ